MKIHTSSVITSSKLRNHSGVGDLSGAFHGARGCSQVFALVGVDPLIDLCSEGLVAAFAYYVHLGE